VVIVKKMGIAFIVLALVSVLTACGGGATRPPEVEEPEDEIESVQPAVAAESPPEDAEDYTEQVADEQEPALDMQEYSVAEQEPVPVAPPDVAGLTPNAQAQSDSAEYEAPAAIQTDMGLMENFVLSHYFPSAGIDWRAPINNMNDASLLAGYISDIVVFVLEPDEVFSPFVGGPPLELSFTLDGVPQTYGIWHSSGGYERFPPGRVQAFKVGDLNPPGTFLAVDERIWDVLLRYDLGRDQL